MSVNPSKQERLISSIYDAAVDDRLLSDALMTLAEVTGCRTASLEIYAPGSIRLTGGRNPLCAPAYQQSYLAYWRDRLPQRKATDSFGVGQVLRSADLWDRESVVASAFFNEWLRPQGMGGDGRYANVAVNGRATAVLGAFKPFSAPDFHPEEQDLFATAAHHFVRALAIHRRLCIAEASQSTTLAGAAPAGFLVVDDEGRILAAHEPTHRQLRAAGLVSSSGDQGRLEAPDTAAERLFAPAGRTGRGPRAGRVEHRGPEGVLLRIMVIPLTQDAAPYDPWLALDRPAALVCVSAPEEADRERAARLADDHGLTPAEAAVAIETARGDGRLGVATRLGISESTVRSHLSAIFDKLGIHRQAELTRLVMDASFKAS
jgi:DNA-binding CsgD family transcriptional regulator